MLHLFEDMYGTFWAKVMNDKIAHNAKDFVFVLVVMFVV